MFVMPTDAPTLLLLLTIQVDQPQHATAQAWRRHPLWQHDGSGHDAWAWWPDAARHADGGYAATAVAAAAGGEGSRCAWGQCMTDCYSCFEQLHCASHVIFHMPYVCMWTLVHQVSLSCRLTYGLLGCIWAQSCFISALSAYAVAWLAFSLPSPILQT